MDVSRWTTDAPLNVLATELGRALAWGMHLLWTLRCRKAVRGIEVNILNIMIALDKTYQEAAHCFNNTNQKEAARISTALAVWFWDRQTSLLRPSQCEGPSRRI